AGYPKVYAAGYEATSESECKPVYQARSQESAHSTVISISSPILTVDMGPKEPKSRYQRSLATFQHATPNSSVVYTSPGYVGCSNIGNQQYYADSNNVLETLSAEVESLDLEATYSIPSAKEAVHITVNSEILDLVGVATAAKHYEAERFDVTINWSRSTPASNFALQLDL
ncbi:hypothetical protein PMAYCL1PPCAC_32287, partial [Pristionchus mayeri]